MSKLNVPLHFNNNYNGKLNQQYFSTVRPFADDAWIVGTRHAIKLGGALIGYAKLIHVQRFQQFPMNSYISYLDAGMPPLEFANLIAKLYNIEVKDLNNRRWCALIFEWFHQVPPDIDKLIIQLNEYLDRFKQIDKKLHTTLQRL